MMHLFRIDAAAISDKGRIRGNNEDNLYFNGTVMPLAEMDKGICLQKSDAAPVQVYAVCDGMGGEEAGELASHAAVTAMKGYSFSPGKDARAAFQELCVRVNDSVYHSADGSAGEKRNGSTFACLLIQDKCATAAHIGDSRVYHLRGGALTQLTRDHSEAQRMLDLGFLTPKQAREHRSRHTLIRYLGTDPNECEAEASVGDAIPLEDGDRYLLCSDGLTDMLSDGQILRLLGENPTSAEAARALVDAALAAGGRDNVTVIVITIARQKLLPFLR